MTDSASATCAQCAGPLDALAEETTICLTCEAVQISGWTDTVETAHALITATVRAALHGARIHPDDLRRLVELEITQAGDVKAKTDDEITRVRFLNLAERRQLGMIGSSYTSDRAARRPLSTYVMPPPGEPWLTQAQFAKQLGVSVDTVGRWTRAGMPSARWGMRAVRILPSRAHAWLEEHYDEGEATP